MTTQSESQIPTESFAYSVSRNCTGSFTLKYSNSTGTVNLTGLSSGNNVTNVGQLKLSGTGTLSGTVTFSLAGAINTYSVSGNYSVNTDCTGSAQLKGLPSNSPANFALVEVSDGQEFLMLETDTNTMVSGGMTQ